MPFPVAQRRRGRLVPVLPGSTAPYAVDEWYHGKQESVPDPIEFTVSDKYLDRGNLYPRQATLIKIIFLRDDLFTQYDHDVIGEWIDQFETTGKEGIQTDIYERIRLNKEAGRPWFRECVIVGGRRGSKGHLGALAGAYVLWNYLALGDPQGHFGVDRDKKLTAITFGGKKDQAKVNQWRDLFYMITGGPCFAPYVSRAQSEILTVFAPHDFARLHQMARRGVFTENDMATFEIVPKESTVLAGRGPTSFMQHYDEMAHVVSTGAIRAASEVYDAATPSLGQFKEWAFLYEGSSPWTETGQFHENYEKALRRDDDGSPAFPEILTVQFPSWALYEDWNRAPIIPLRPAKMVRIERVAGTDSLLPEVQVIERMEHSEEVPHFRELRGALMEYGPELQQLEKANRDNFNVEYRAWWAASLNNYLDYEKVKRIWEPVGDRHFVQQTRGVLSIAYRAHGDPSKSGANFGFSIAHSEEMPTAYLDPKTGEVEHRVLKHVVFDVLHAWIPGDFPGGQIDYLAIEDEINDYIDRFMPTMLTFDQFNSASPIAHHRKHIREARLPKGVVVDEITATEPYNWKIYETLKTAINMGLVHGPYFELADLELRFLQNTGKRVDHPTSGPVQTKDVADTMANVVYALVGTQIEEMIQALGGLHPGAALPGGTEVYSETYGDQFSMAGRQAVGARRGYAGGKPGSFRREATGRPNSWRPGR